MFAFLLSENAPDVVSVSVSDNLGHSYRSVGTGFGLEHGLGLGLANMILKWQYGVCGALLKRNGVGGPIAFYV